MPDDPDDNRSLIESCKEARSQSIEQRCHGAATDRMLKQKSREQIRASKELLARTSNSQQNKYQR